MHRFLPWLLALAVLTMAAPVAAQDSVISLEPGDVPPISTGDDMDLAPASAAPEEPVPPAPCGDAPITIARMQWPTAALLAEIHARILRAQFGCEVEIVPGDLAATASSMGATGQPAVAPELWITRVADIWNAAVKSREVRQAGASYAEPVFEGWYVPDYVADGHPELTTIKGLKAAARQFASGGTKGRLISCPPDWGCAVLNRNLLRANGLAADFDVVEPANRFELDTLIAEAVGRQEPILFYYWEPNAVLAQFAFRRVDLGPYNHDAFVCLGRMACASPEPSGFAPDSVAVALAEWVYLDAPEVAAYFQRARMPFAEMNALLQNLNLPGATIEGVADAFVAARGEIWQPWVGRPPG